MASTSSTDGSREIVVLVVHGIGEQTCFEQLETVAANVYQALENGRAIRTDEDRPTMEVHRGTETPRHSPEPSLRNTAATIRWPGQSGEVIAHFREVHWADLDERLDFAGWWRFVGWALAVAGVRTFSTPSRAGPPGDNGMYPPRTLSALERFGTRLRLFAVSLGFLVVLGTIGLLDLVLKRLSIRIKIIERGYRILFDYLGDVKLYQDWYVRTDQRVEVVGVRSRVAIRARMASALLRTASDALANEDIAGFYVFAHSLGTVVAFNALMETEVALPNYLDKDEWKSLHPRLKKAVAERPGEQLPARRPWLDPYNGGCAAVDREVLFEKFLGFLTVGCPLDKFAAIWPTIVPLNGQRLTKSVPWINVYDVQDVVAGGALDLFEPEGKPIEGLTKREIAWADQWWLWRAHTSYWSAKRGRARLIDAICRWLAGAPFDFNPPPAGIKWRRLVFGATIAAAGVELLWLFAWLVNRVATLLARTLPERYGWLTQWLRDQHIAGHYRETIVPLMGKTLVFGIGTIVVCVVVRAIWERVRFRKPPRISPRVACGTATGGAPRA